MHEYWYKEDEKTGELTALMHGYTLSEAERVYKVIKGKDVSDLYIKFIRYCKKNNIQLREVGMQPAILV